MNSAKKTGVFMKPKRITQKKSNYQFIEKFKSDLSKDPHVQKELKKIENAANKIKLSKKI